MSARYLAIVTARAGSKRLPHKNIKPLCGHPLFIWSVMAAQQCPAIQRVIVSTDSAEYQSIALAAGADCPWLRDPALAADATSSADVVRSVLDLLGEELSHYAGLVLLQPTSPLRTAQDISGALALYEESRAPAVVSISESECPPAWIGQLSDTLSLDDFTPPAMRTMTNQAGRPWYRLNGAVYVIGIDVFRREHGFLPKGTLGYVMPRERSVDVDTAFDFAVAEALMTSGREPHHG